MEKDDYNRSVNRIYTLLDKYKCSDLKQLKETNTNAYIAFLKDLKEISEILDSIFQAGEFEKDFDDYIKQHGNIINLRGLIGGQISNDIKGNRNIINSFDKGNEFDELNKLMLERDCIDQKIFLIMVDIEMYIFGLIMQHVLNFEKIDDDFINMVSEHYYEYAERLDAVFETECFDQLFTRNIIENGADEPNNRHWGELLKLRLKEISQDPRFIIIRKSHSYKSQIDISNVRIMNHLFVNCVEVTDLNLFFKTLAEINFLTAKVRPNIYRVVRPVQEGNDNVELPELIADWIRNDAKLQRMFYDALISLNEKMGRGFKIKWCHIHKLWIDEFFIPEMNAAEFGRLIHEMIPSVNADNISANITRDSPLGLGDAESRMKYYELPITNKVNSICRKCRDEYYKGLIQKRP